MPGARRPRTNARRAARWQGTEINPGWRAGSIGLLVLCLLAAHLVDRKRGPAAAEIAPGQSVVLEDFARDRSYVTYRIDGFGRRYWYGYIAERFLVPKEWKRIASSALELEGQTLTGESVVKAQYRVEPGTEVRIPLYGAK